MAEMRSTKIGDVTWIRRIVYTGGSNEIGLFKIGVMWILEA